MTFKQEVAASLELAEDVLTDLAGQIWERPELAFQEFFASGLIMDHLEKQGFSIQKNIAQMPTAFIASWGKGSPVIGILGEYDALPEFSQKVSTTKEPVIEGAPGHGCGHNLLGVGCLGAAVTTKELMVKHHINGTLKYYGCPAEETLAGKIFMAREGVFDDLDAALTWHPYASASVAMSSSNALNSFKASFHGVSAHAADNPDQGRSALKAVELTNSGINYLREHIIDEARIHYVITDGGKVPNVVPSYSQGWYYVRAPKREQVEDIYQRVLDIVKGAALMTGTTFDLEFVSGCYNNIMNETISKVMGEQFKSVGSVLYTPEENEFALKILESIPEGTTEGTLKFLGETKERAGFPMSGNITERLLLLGKGRVARGSTDVADVCHIVPTAMAITPLKPFGIPQHSWQNVAFSGSSIGNKAMMLAAKVISMTALELYTKPDILKAAKEEFRQQMGAKPYKSPLPEEASPDVPIAEGS